ncbi:hypothetical protein [Microcystis sp. M061S2]|uniref:hypothetical protein n=1 Tax=Microcystis sp. M061S2 TaxID=2771171 RepID=UPI0025892C79|nr:hypothetical protein [Microcystis sp. M061S2]
MVAFATLKADGMIDDGKRYLPQLCPRNRGIYETAGLVPRTPTAEFPDKITVTGEKVLEAEYIISFTPEAIHQVQAIGEEPVICF